MTHGDWGVLQEAGSAGDVWATLARHFTSLVHVQFQFSLCGLSTLHLHCLDLYLVLQDE